MFALLIYSYTSEAISLINDGHYLGLNNGVLPEGALKGIIQIVKALANQTIQIKIICKFEMSGF
ncbi:MAG: hypothetical protein COA99_05425 [Moraxellaceae bacterium]|nr:MAG: hypothetical protein COA99_05425 [Moraxellaceae bacterium]